MKDIEAPPPDAAAQPRTTTAASASASREKDSPGQKHGGQPKTCGCKAIMLAIVCVCVAVFCIGCYALGPVHKPSFNLDDVTLYSFNLSQPNNLLHTKVMATISSQNRNRKINIQYGNLNIHLTLADSRVTEEAFVSGTLQEPGESLVWTVELSGNDVTVGPKVVEAVRSRIVMGSVKLKGWVEWTVGLATTWRFGLHMDCPVGIHFGAGQGAKYQLLQQGCDVSFLR